MTIDTTVAAVDNRAARTKVIDYYTHCRNDYRIIWRTDENGSIHFGFFDDEEPRSRVLSRAALAAVQACVGVAATVAAAVLGLVPSAWCHEAMIRCLRVAARGRMSRHDVGQDRMISVCAEMVAPRRGDRVLDAGCGIGGADRWLASRFGAFVCGLNILQPQLVFARDRTDASSGPGRVRFSRQDYTEMGIAGGAFDIVWGLESICHCENKQAFVREAHRVLRRGGRIMVADFFRTRDGLSQIDASRVETWTAGWAIPNLASVAGFRDLLEASGFVNVRYRDIKRNVLPSGRRLYKASFVAQPIHQLLERARLRSAIQGANILAARLQYETFVDDLCTYGIFVAEK
jgi:ubiquinone/menaquinone biosynthesis C-methylase UbiE